MLEPIPSDASLRGQASPRAGHSSVWTASTPDPEPSHHTRVLHAFHSQLVQLQLPGLQQFSLLKQRLIKGDTGWDVRCGPAGDSAHQCTGQQPWHPAAARRGLPILVQEALVLGLGLDVGNRCSHLLVNGHHLVLHQAANLQVFLQDLLPAPRWNPGSAGGLRLDKARKLGARGTGFGPTLGLIPTTHHLPVK